MLLHQLPRTSRSVTLAFARYKTVAHSSPSPLYHTRNHRFSSGTTPLESNSNAPKKAAPPRQRSVNEPGPDDPPSFSLRDLGISGKSKIFIVACLTVAGTVESIFWIKVFWAKYGPAQEETSEEGGESGG
jgi:hypothetical protein